MKVSIDTKSIVTTLPASAGPLIQPDRRGFIGPDPMEKLLVRDLLNTIPVSSNSVEYAKELVFTNNAGYQANEGDTKPESTMTFQEATANLKQTAHFINMSRQSVEDAPMLQSYIQSRMLQGLSDKQEDMLVGGAGGASEIQGFYSGAASATLVQVDIIDRVAEAILAVVTSGYSADAIIMNPVDWFTFQIKKDTTNQYLFSNPQGASENRLWGLPVVLSNRIAAGNFMVGAFRQGAEIYVRSSVDVRISDQHASNFTQNLLTLLVEQRLGLAILRPASFVKGTYV